MLKVLSLEPSAHLQEAEMVKGWIGDLGLWKDITFLPQPISVQLYASLQSFGLYFVFIMEEKVWNTYVFAF